MLETKKCIISAYIVLSISLAVLYHNYIKQPDKFYPFPDLGTVKVWLTRLPWFSSGDLAVDYCFNTCFFVSAICFITGELTGNWSQVDKLWSLLPVTYTWIITLVHPNTRLWMMTLAVSVWGFRLTYNFIRRGGYGWPPWSGEEDYRWNYVRKWPIIRTKLGGSLFNFAFICVYQNILLFLTASPAIICSRYTSLESWQDFALTISILLLVYIEYTADQQQYNFQTQKWRIINSEQKLQHPYNIGFPCHGLFSVSRHPNYAAEMSIWFVFYLYTISAGAGLLNWTLSGSVLLALLFQGSTLLSESITTNKYDLYTRYKTIVPRFLGLYNLFKSDYPSVIDVRD